MRLDRPGTPLVGMGEVGWLFFVEHAGKNCFKPHFLKGVLQAPLFEEGVEALRRNVVSDDILLVCSSLNSWQRKKGSA